MHPREKHLELTYSAIVRACRYDPPCYPPFISHAINDRNRHSMTEWL